VVRALDTVPDNAVGAFHPTSQTGNMVVIDHGAGEYSFFAHLRRGSVRVRAGQRVAAGEPIGECGNSGRTTAPHLHYHLMDRPDPGPGTRSRPAQFQDYVADGVRVPRGEPRKGQLIRPPR
jgi:murein DD-endopeptidase MepM/ murein hydrolase activator NlpD